ncbi:MAG: DJ-1/PfpI family protein [Lentisphaerae bacterium]|jgi:4-methyl-5(b-hydroxyethyl)-thiazole monophosphate biosynthesis|nr:DJ-1/PfpI family protein [Victivallaceae bacterium]MDD3115855.1 DJ-1/PfpI family protein [Victivallaceae bacterium]MDD3702686.1 DJ-1/PfpI family protein [Victivallaceae bacterium]MDD5662841.1 DJ-1/PfpI family protein [Victivallaceae bacterium]NLK83557.1 DJ-1/PfpI family protein [Lentisphaerota bacterium]
MKKIMVILAEGFEEIEAVGAVDILRRCSFEVVTAGLDSTTINGAHQIEIHADKKLSELNPEDFDAVVLPGGMPGSANLRDSIEVKNTVTAVYQQGGIAAAICAAPMALAAFGLTEKRRITGYPGMENQFGNCNYTGNMAETDGRIVTGKGPAAVFEFAAALAEALGKSANEVLKGMLYSGSL